MRHRDPFQRSSLAPLLLGVLLILMVAGAAILLIYALP